MAPEQIINIDSYPLGELESPQAEKQLKELSGIFCSEGVCVLEDFIRPEILPKIVQEAQELVPRAFHNEVCGNAYLDSIDENLPEDHARRMTETTSLGAVAYDQIPASSLIRTVYEWPAIMKFVRAIVTCGELYQYDCPLGALNLTVMKNEDYLRWHFDQSDFVVSIPLQQAEKGGAFEYVRNIRSDSDENYEAVRDVLNGKGKNIQSLEDKPGSLVLFRGMNTIHRVSKIKGNKLRLGALLSYVDEPGVKSSDYLKMIRYGRTK